MSLHRAAVQLLASWVAPDAQQEALRMEFLAHLSRYPDGIWRHCAPGHITASVLVIEPGEGLDRDDRGQGDLGRRDRALLTLHPKVGRWLQLGGHLEPSDQTVPGAALREAVEESGIGGLRLLGGPVALDRHRVECRPGGSDHLDVQFVALPPRGAQPRISAESLDLQWFDCDDLPASADGAVRRLVSAARGLVSGPALSQ